MPEIMICDDEPVSVFPIVERLEYEGVAVDTTVNAHDCLKKASQNSYSLFMLDMQIGPNNPGQLWHGLELADKLRKEGLAGKAPIIGITGHMPDRRQEALARGFTRFFEKPYSVGDVVRDTLNLIQTEESISEISLGDVTYILCQASMVIRGSGTYSIEDLKGYIEGTGEKPEMARQDFERKVHEQFQRIRSKMPEHRNSRENDIWNALERAIDISEYDRRQIITIPHEVGFIAEITRTGRRVIKWHDEERSEVDLRDSPDLAPLMEGQWFKAVVQRKESTYDLVKILHVDPISKPPIYSREEREEFWNQ